MNVLFLSPHYPLEMRDFTRGLAEVGARVFGLGNTDIRALPDTLLRYLSGYVRATDMRDARAVVRDIRATLGDRPIDRIECLWEPWVVLAAELRALMGVPGMSVDTVIGFRDKGLMKERIAAAGLRVPGNARVSTTQEARDAATDIGFPLVLKPIAGAGSANTHLVRDERELDDVLSSLSHVPEISVEEYIAGQEYTYDAVAIDGRPVFESVAEYLPKPIESRSLQWISPAQIVYRNPYEPELASGIELGRGVLQALGMGTGFVHMEWFKPADGQAVFGEIAARAGGAKLVDQMNFANDFDVYREWARAVCWHTFEDEPRRRYHTVVVFKRAIGQGRITHIEGMRELRALCGQDLVLEHLLPIGHPRRDWKATLLSDGYVLMRHPDLRRCADMMHFAVNHVRMYAA